jgi:hypothetical protein
MRRQLLQLLLQTPDPPSRKSTVAWSALLHTEDSGHTPMLQLTISGWKAVWGAENPLSDLPFLASDNWLNTKHTPLLSNKLPTPNQGIRSRRTQTKVMAMVIIGCLPTLAAVRPSQGYLRSATACLHPCPLRPLVRKTLCNRLTHRQSQIRHQHLTIPSLGIAQTPSIKWIKSLRRLHVLLTWVFKIRQVPALH